MADKRMFSRKIIDDDNFTELSSASQALYLHLSMAADDDGICNQVSIAMFRSHASASDLQSLIDKHYIYQFDSGVVVIKHWRMSNAIRKDRYIPTSFQKEYAMLALKDNGSYTWKPNIDMIQDKELQVKQLDVSDDGCRLVASWLPSGCQVVATGKDRLGKDSIGKDSIGKDSIHIELPKGSSRSDASDQEIAVAVDNWNKTSFKSVHKLERNSKRYKNLSARIKQYGIDDVLKAIDMANNSTFLLGGNKRSWVMTFDWFVLPNNFVKVLDGNYTDNSQKEDDVF